MTSLLTATTDQQLALQFLQTSSSIATPEQLALVRMNPQVPRFGQLQKAARVNWLKDQLMVLHYLRHIKEINELDILIDATSTDDAIMENPDFRCLTQVEIQDAFKHGINGEYGEFFGITAPTLIGFLRAYQKAEKWQKAKAIVYAKEKEAQEAEKAKENRMLYEMRAHGLKLPFWGSTRQKNQITPEESEAHRQKIARQREEILKAKDNETEK